jgi:hypothetical protein
MVTKWEIPRIDNFNDVPKFLNKRYSIFKSVALPQQGKRPYSCGFTMHVNPSESMLFRDILVQLLNDNNWSLTLPFSQLAQLMVEHHIPYHKCSTEIDTGAKSAFEEGKAYYERNKESLTRKYNGEYIAIWNNEVMEHDTSFSALAQRVYKKLGYVSIYMPFVTLKRRLLRFESPERRSANES